MRLPRPVIEVLPLNQNKAELGTRAATRRRRFSLDVPR